MTANITRFLLTEFGYTVGFVKTKVEKSKDSEEGPAPTKQWYMMHNMYRHITTIWPTLVELNKICGHQSMRETVICILETIVGNGKEPWPVFQRTPKMLTSSHKGITNYGYIHRARITLQVYLFCMFITIKKYITEFETGRAKAVFQVMFESEHIFFTFIMDRLERDPNTHKLCQYIYVYIPTHVIRLGEIRMFNRPNDTSVQRLDQDPKTIESLNDYKAENIKPKK